MTVEIIFQCGDKDFWEDVFMETDKEKQNKENICKVYDTLLKQLQKEMPDFKLANAVVHFDEASPHMHVVGVPIGRGFKRGLETKVSKRSVFTPKTLENILQNSLRQTASIEMLIHFGVLVKEKQKGKNHDLTVAEYKVQQETKQLEMVTGFLEEKQDRLFDTSQRLEQAEKEVSKADRHLSDTKMEIAGAEKAISHSTIIKKAMYDNKIVGMARAIGDGMSYLLVDVVASSKYQKQGIGKKLVNSIINDIKSETMDGEYSTINLISIKGMEKFYESCGFKEVPFGYNGKGMRMKIEK